MTTVKMFDYWAFHNDGTAQFFQVCNGEISDYRYYDNVKDAPIVLLRDDIRYHGKAYKVPVQQRQERN